MNLIDPVPYYFTYNDVTYTYGVGQIEIDYPDDYTGPQQIIYGGQCQFDDDTLLETASRMFQMVPMQMERMILLAIESAASS